MSGDRHDVFGLESIHVTDKIRSQGQAFGFMVIAVHYALFCFNKAIEMNTPLRICMYVTGLLMKLLHGFL